MAIPAAIQTGLQAFITAVQAAAPLTSATRITLTALQAQGNALIAQIDTALDAAAGGLDAGDPTGFPADFAAELLGLATANRDQAKLAEMRGLVGRAMFNIDQASPS